jgi:Gamma-glutamyltransferase
VPGNGPLGATIPAMLDAMALALEAKGTMHLDQVLQPAIELADGFPMYEFLRNFFVSERKATEQWEWSKKTYYPDGHVPEVGESSGSRTSRGHSVPSRPPTRRRLLRRTTG